MKSTTLLSLTALLLQASHTTADSVCSSGLYAALAPLDTYAPAVSYCQGQADKTTVTVTATVTAVAKREPATTANAKTTATTASTKTTATTLKTIATTTSSNDAKASAWSSLVAQAKSVIATFCSCAGYPATTTVCLLYISFVPYSVRTSDTNRFRSQQPLLPRLLHLPL